MPYSLEDVRSLSQSDANDCWIWQLGKTGSGYGAVAIEGRSVYVHRIVADLTLGPCPEGQEVMHSCDVRACVNPDHLAYGTRAENLAHMRARGRGPSGVRTPKSPLTEDQVSEIRILQSQGVRKRWIADTHGITVEFLNRVVGPVHRRHASTFPADLWHVHRNSLVIVLASGGVCPGDDCDGSASD